jgi:hypothetical protein
MQLLLYKFKAVYLIFAHLSLSIAAAMATPTLALDMRMVRQVFCHNATAAL